MRRPPRAPEQRLFSMKSIGLALLQGVTALAACLVVYLAARPIRGDDAARALTFAALVVSFLAIILANRSWASSILGSLGRPNQALWWVLGGTAALLFLALYLPPLQRLFHFAPVAGLDLLLACAAGLASILWFEVFKVVRQRRVPEAGRA